MQITKQQAILLGVVIIAVLFRVLVASNINMGSDELVYGIRGVNFLSTNRLSMLEQSVTYYYLQGLVYNTFGVSALTTRLPNIIFGAMSVLLVFLIGKEVFDLRKGLLASFFFAISSYALLYNYEMDAVAIFLMLFSLYFYIKGLRHAPHFFLWSAFFLGLALMVKSFALLFVPVYILYYFLYHKAIKIDKQTIRLALLAALVIILIVLPVLSYNYFLYKDKGMVDIIVSQYLGLHQEQYQGLGAEKSWEAGRFVSLGTSALLRFLREDSLLFLLGILGIILAYRRKQPLTTLLVLCMMVPAVFLLGITFSANHYVLLFPFLSLFAALPVEGIISYGGRLKIKNAALAVLMILLIASVIHVGISERKGFSRSSIVELRDAAREIPADALVIADSRIYRGNIAYAFHDRHYLESSSLGQVQQQLEQVPSTAASVKTYFIECTSDDCGWGRSKISEELNASMESIVSMMAPRMTKLREIDEGNNNYAIYQGSILLKPEIIPRADSTHYFFAYPVGWWTTEEVFDIYEVNGAFDSLLNMAAYASLWLGIIAVLLSPLYLIYLVTKKEESSQGKQHSAQGVSSHEHHSEGQSPNVRRIRSC